MTIVESAVQASLLSLSDQMACASLKDARSGSILCGRVAITSFTSDISLLLTAAREARAARMLGAVEERKWAGMGNVLYLDM
jgi:hypothetical protein